MTTLVTTLVTNAHPTHRDVSPSMVRLGLMLVVNIAIVIVIGIVIGRGVICLFL